MGYPHRMQYEFEWSSKTTLTVRSWVHLNVSTHQYIAVEVHHPPPQTSGTQAGGKTAQLKMTQVGSGSRRTAMDFVNCHISYL